MKDNIQRIIDLAVQIQQIAAPTFHEQKRAEFVRELFVEEGLTDVSIDEAGNVYGRWSMGDDQKVKVKPLVISAHLDTVFPFEMDLSVRHESDKVFGIGIGDNSLGVAALIGLAWMMKERHTSGVAGDIWFVANVCEEGLGDLRGMRAVVDRFGEDVLAYLVLEGMALGHIYHKAVGVKRYRVTARTRGGHSWSDYGQPSAVLELSKLVVQLSSLKLPSQPRTTMNVGRIKGGTSINVIPAEACLELDLRSEGRAELAELVSGVDQLIEAANKTGVRIEAEVIGERPAGEMSARHPLVGLAEQCLRAQGLEPHLTSGSTDANIPLSRGYPALVLGVTNGGGAHTKNEFIHARPVAQGMEQLIMFVENVWG
ncbi:MAG: peptidase M20 [Anaerolineales bacterium]|nr:MAG: peptidase M20 [Anaerolineales bacterium]